MLPALAVAESLRKLGAEVTFASNADSRLVRDAGYELDVFGAERQKVETLASEWTTDEQPAPWNETVARLYRAARRQALGVDRILEDLLGELPRLSDETVSPSKR